MSIAIFGHFVCLLNKKIWKGNVQLNLPDWQYIFIQIVHNQASSFYPLEIVVHGRETLL